jgi:hypothetical protein
MNHITKTTIISNVIDEMFPEGIKYLIIKNEFFSKIKLKSSRNRSIHDGLR